MFIRNSNTKWPFLFRQDVIMVTSTCQVAYICTGDRKQCPHLYSDTAEPKYIILSNCSSLEPKRDGGRTKD